MAEEPKKDEERERDDADAGTLLKTCIDRLDAMHKRMDAMEVRDRKDAEREEEDEPKKAVADKRKDAEDEDEEDEKSEKKDSTVFYKGEKAPKPKDDSEKEEPKKDSKKDESEDKKEREDADDESMGAMIDKKKKDKMEKADREMADAFDPREAIAQLERRLPKMLTAAEREQFSEVQARADSIFHAFGQKAPEPLQGEDIFAYRQRLAKKLKAHSPGFKDVNLYAIADAAAFKAIEDTIYADSMRVAFSPATAAPGTLRAVSETRGGHEFITYVGDPASWMNDFAGPVRMNVTAFNTPNGGQR